MPLFLAVLVAAHMLTTTLHWYCPIARLTHHPCPTCGLSRAVAYCFVGQYRYAFAQHPLFVVVVPFVAIVASLELSTYVWTGELGRWTKKRPIGIIAFVLAAALFALWIARFFGLFGGPVVV